MEIKKFPKEKNMIKFINQSLSFECDTSEVSGEEVEHKLFGVLDRFWGDDQVGDVYIYIDSRVKKFDNQISFTNLEKGHILGELLVISCSREDCTGAVKANLIAEKIRDAAKERK